MLFLASPALAQISFAIKGGVNLSQLHHDEVLPLGARTAEAQPKPGYHIGANIIYDINQRYSLRSGIFFITKGTSYNLEKLNRESYAPDDVQFDGYSRRRLDYIEVPIQLSYKFLERFQLYAGPYAALLVGGRSKDKYSLDTRQLKETVDRNDKITPVLREVSGIPELLEIHPYWAFDYGANLGLGYTLHPFLFSMEYSYGLGNLGVDVKGWEDREHRKRQNRVLYFSVSYLLSSRKVQ